SHGSRLFYNAPVPEPSEPIHEVEAMMRLVAPLGVTGPPPPMSVTPSEAEVEKALQYLRRVGLKETDRVVAMQISSRKPQNRWPRERFRELADKLQEKPGLRVLLLWAPGSETNALHPGDDEKADWLISSMAKKPLVYRTGTLAELIAAMSLAETVVTPDGGAMHIAAALSKPVLTIWGSTDIRRWAPWGVPHIILRNDTGQAGSISSEEAFEAFTKLYARLSK
ncbi:MAG TPA: glycosyltransferase family 9 protein, partial [Thermodesulfobacteriota bacterium]|nr:glycosyltransferase family 9 protein [Thermodesulfobacteriota bacterium]